MKEDTGYDKAWKTHMFEGNHYEVCILMVTPSIAYEYLQQNTANRRISPKTVAKYGDTMKRGEWVLNGDAIVFDKDGQLVDGQHRLKACLKEHTSFETIVVKGVGTSAFKTKDLHKKRSVGDSLGIAYGQSMKSCTVVGSAISYLHRHRGGNIYRTGLTAQPTPTQAIELLEDNPELMRCIERANKGRTEEGLPKALGGALFLIFSEISKDSAELFFSQLNEGIGLERGSPIILLRRYLSNAYRNKQRDSGLMLAWAINAWNYFREGRSCRTLKIKPDQQLPRIGGLRNTTGKFM